MITLISLRQRAILDGRCLIRVRKIKDKQMLSAAVCPGCWNSLLGRKRLIEEMKMLGVEVISKYDRPDGVYQKSHKHSKSCPLKK